MPIKTGRNMHKTYIKYINNAAILPKIRRYLFILIIFIFGGFIHIDLITSDAICIGI